MPVFTNEELARIRSVKNLGDGWATKNAGDLMRMGVIFGGVEAKDIILEINKFHNGTTMVNMATVERALGNLSDREANRK